MWTKKRILTPEQVKALPIGTEVHLEGRDRYGELTWLEGRVQQGYKGKVFAYHDHSWSREIKSIRAYPGKEWTVQA
jgi:hypothetical protein